MRRGAPNGKATVLKTVGSNPLQVRVLSPPHYSEYFTAHILSLCYNISMATEPLISWYAPEHFHVEKNPDWYWIVGIITLAIAAVAFIFGNIITGIFVIVAAVALVLHASHKPENIYHEINDRGIIIRNTLFPFLTIESFWIPHDEVAPKIILKSRKLFMPFIVIYIEEIDPEIVREVLLKYIAETEHKEHFLVHLFEKFGF